MNLQLVATHIWYSPPKSGPPCCIEAHGSPCPSCWLTRLISSSFLHPPQRNWGQSWNLTNTHHIVMSWLGLRSAHHNIIHHHWWCIHSRDHSVSSWVPCAHLPLYMHVHATMVTVADIFCRCWRPRVHMMCNSGMFSVICQESRQPVHACTMIAQVVCAFLYAGMHVIHTHCSFVMPLFQAHNSCAQTHTPHYCTISLDSHIKLQTNHQ